MKINEGNIYHYLDVNGWIDVTIKLDHLIDYKIHPERYKPILLTEEWLLKLGFEYKNFTVPDEDGVYRNKKEPNKEYFCHCKLPNELSYYLPYYYFNYYIGSVTVKYVHTLQNLYFALTGNELQIK